MAEDGVAQGLVQDAARFTVQVVRRGTGAVVGTGFLVSPDLVVTCAHVVEDAGVVPRTGLPRETGLRGLLGGAREKAAIPILLPEGAAGAHGLAEAARREAVVDRSFLDRGEDDVVVLRIVGPPLDLPPETFAVLGAAEGSRDHRFKAYGFVRMDEVRSREVNGVIRGPVERRERLLGRMVQVDATTEVVPGMSGSALLDLERNLVVGVVAATWMRNGETGGPNLAWAVDAHVLSMDPVGLPLHPERRLRPRPRRQAGGHHDAEKAILDPGEMLRHAPAPLKGWVGRRHLLDALRQDLADPRRRVAVLVGLGGEGKTTLARRWVDDLCADPATRPGGVFWWTFGAEPVARFFEDALAFLTRGRVHPDDYRSPAEKARLLAAMLERGRYVFVLDGLEAVQRPSGPDQGKLDSEALLAFLEYFASPGHPSFCLVTSRMMVTELRADPECVHYPLGGLTPEESREMLASAGVTGVDPAAIDRLAARLGGHPLALRLAGGILARDAGAGAGDALARLDRLASAPPDLLVGDILAQHDALLTPEERGFLVAASACRVPVPTRLLAALHAIASGRPETEASDERLAALAQGLADRQILREGAPGAGDARALHPLVRDHYRALLATLPGERRRALHRRLKKHHLAAAPPDPGEGPTLARLAPLLEAVHHACAAGDVEEALRIHQDLVEGDDMDLSWKLNAYDAAHAVLVDLLPHAEGEPGTGLLPKGEDKWWVLNRMAATLTNLARLDEAAAFHRRAIALATGAGFRRGLKYSHQNVAEMASYRGDLAAMIEASRTALRLAEEDADDESVRDSLVCLGWGLHLQGRIDEAAEFFARAARTQARMEPDDPVIHDIWGAMHADHLRLAGHLDEARRVAEANLAWATKKGQIDNRSIFHRILGEVAGAAEDDEAAGEHLDEAVRIARSVTETTVLLEALVARGRWAAVPHPAAAERDLGEALELAKRGGYRIYEVDARLGIARVRYAQRAGAEAQAHAEYARTRAAEMGYARGLAEAEALLSRRR